MSPLLLLLPQIDAIRNEAFLELEMTTQEAITCHNRVAALKLQLRRKVIWGLAVLASHARFSTLRVVLAAWRCGLCNRWA